MERRADDKRVQLLLFKLGKETYCLDTINIQGIIRLENLIKTDYPIKVSDLPFYMELMVQFQGKFIPIVDLRKIFILPQQKSMEKNRIIIIQVNNIKIGIEVDSISNLINVSQNFIHSFDIYNYSKNDVLFFLNIRQITNYQKRLYNLVI